MPEHNRPKRLSRRDFIRASILVTGAATLLPVSAHAAKPREVPRNRTLTLVWTGREGRIIADFPGDGQGQGRRQWTN